VNAPRAYLRDLKNKIVGETLPPERVAAGWALGMFIGCFIPFGMQLVVSIPLAVMLRISRIGATVGTLVTNPVTIFFIYPVQIWVGSRLVGHPFTWEYLRTDVVGRLCEATVWSLDGWRVLAGLGGRVLGGFFAGGFLLALVLTPITYFAVKRIVLEARRFHVARLEKEERQDEN